MNHRYFATLLSTTTFLILLSLETLIAGPEDLDTTFGENGRVVLDIAGLSDYLTDIALQPDGKIVACGTVEISAATEDFVVARFLADGSLDTSFSHDGIALIDFAGENENRGAVEVLPDGKILVVCTARLDGEDGIGLARLKTDGTFDPTFSSDGRARAEVPGFDLFCKQFALQADGKIVAVAFTRDQDGNTIIVLARFLPHGVLDTTFNGTGWSFLDMSPFGQTQANDIAIQTDGKIVVTGFLTRTGTSRDFFVLRYESDGSLDPDFGDSGAKIFDMGGNNDIAYRVLVTDEGKILVGGTGGNGNGFGVARLLSNGNFDTSFNGSGKAIYNRSGIAGGEMGMALQKNGFILLSTAEFVPNNPSGPFAQVVVQLEPEGGLNTSFGGGGYASTGNAVHLPVPVPILVAPGGEIFMGGSSESPDPNVGSVDDFTIVKLEGDLFPAITVEFPSGSPVVDGEGEIAFDDTAISSSDSRSITIRNTGRAPLNGLTAAFSGDHPGDFTAGAFASTTVAPGATTSLTVSFSPTTDTERTARLEIGSNDSDHAPFSIHLSGAGFDPEIQLEENGVFLTDGNSTIDYGDVEAGSGGIGFTFVVHNSGNGPLENISLAIVGQGQSSFQLGNIGSTTIQPGHYEPFPVRFNPTGPGVRNATLRVFSNDRDENPFDVNITGRGLDPEIAIQYPVGSNLADGSSARLIESLGIGSPATANFRILNTGTESLSNLSTSVSGSNAAEFVVSGLNVSEVSPGDFTDFTVTFTPGADGTRSATLQIVSNDRDENPFDIQLTGRAVDLSAPGAVTATKGTLQGQVVISWDIAPNAYQYEIFRGLQPTGSDALRLATSNGTEHIDSAGLPGREYYYFVKSKRGDLITGLSVGAAGYGTAGLPFRPDGLVGKRTSSAKGNNIYVSGRSQELKQVSRRLRKLRWYLETENDGETRDILRQRVTKANSLFRAKLRHIGGGNVTGLALVGLLDLDIDGGSKERFWLEVKPHRRTKGKRKRRTFSFSTRSLSDTRLSDTVRAKVETK